MCLKLCFRWLEVSEVLLNNSCFEFPLQSTCCWILKHLGSKKLVWFWGKFQQHLKELKEFQIVLWFARNCTFEDEVELQNEDTTHAKMRLCLKATLNTEVNQGHSLSSNPNHIWKKLFSSKQSKILKSSFWNHWNLVSPKATEDQSLFFSSYFFSFF